jgi:hypothetical protein
VTIINEFWKIVLIVTSPGILPVNTGPPTQQIAPSSFVNLQPPVPCGPCATITQSPVLGPGPANPPFQQPPHFGPGPVIPPNQQFGPGPVIPPNQQFGPGPVIPQEQQQLPPQQISSLRMISNNFNN